MTTSSRLDRSAVQRLRHLILTGTLAMTLSACGCSGDAATGPASTTGPSPTRTGEPLTSTSTGGGVNPSRPGRFLD
jgi:hypothetical protein